MFRNILVGVDRHAGGRDAIELSRGLLADGGELTLGHVYSGESRILPLATTERDLLERERIVEFLEAICREAGVRARVMWRESASVGRGLHELCELIGADLLVVGSSRRGPLGRILLADDTRAALHGAPCPVAVAPAGYRECPVPFDEIGVGDADAVESGHALAAARVLAAELGARLSACDRGVNGSAAEQLVRFSGSVDLLVVGSRDYGVLGRFAHGSASAQLARSAHCPLLVVTRAAVAAPRAGG